MYTIFWAGGGEHAVVLHVLSVQQQLGLDTQCGAGAEQAAAAAQCVGELSLSKELPAEEQPKEAVKERRSQGAHIADSIPFDPYPDYSGINYVDKYGPVETCYLDANDTIKVPGLRAYKGVPQGMPDNVIGSYETLGLRNDVCFERFGRLGPYGLGYSKRRGGTGAGMGAGGCCSIVISSS